MDQKLQEQQEDLFDEIEDDDYIFIIDKKGKLKAAMMPNDPEDFKIPPNVQKIMKIFKNVVFHSNTIH